MAAGRCRKRGSGEERGVLGERGGGVITCEGNVD